MNQPSFDIVEDDDGSVTIFRAPGDTETYAHAVIRDAQEVMRETLEPLPPKLVSALRAATLPIAFITGMEVPEEDRGRGIGTLLLDRLLAELDRRGVTTTFLMAMAIDVGWQPQLETFYRRRGFRVVARTGMGLPIMRRDRPATVGSFSDIQRALTPRRRVLIPSLIPSELLHPHNMPDDPAWPTPAGWPHVNELLDRLPRQSQVLCALIAAEMALPVWREWAATSTYHPEVSADELVALAWAWLDGAATTADARAFRPRTNWYPRHMSAEANNAYLAAVRLAAAIAEPDNVWFTEWLTDGVINGMQAVAGEGRAFAHVTARWWRRCRAAMAYADPEQTEI